jgi:SPP1 family predicted phage head-tail adaptor
MTFRTGELDQRITFQERISVSDGMGGSVDTWTDIATLSSVWAHVRPKSGREVTEYDRVNAEAGYLFVIRNRSDILDSYRIMWDGLPFNIKARKQPKTRALYLEIDGERGAPQ